MSEGLVCGPALAEPELISFRGLSNAPLHKATGNGEPDGLSRAPGHPLGAVLTSDGGRADVDRRRGWRRSQEDERLMLAAAPLSAHAEPAV